MDLLQTRSAAKAATLGFALLLVTSPVGCRWNRLGDSLTVGSAQAPPVIQATSPVDQIIAAVNQNAVRVQSYTAPNATFSTPGLAGAPLLRGSIVLQRPRNFRLQAGTALTGGEVDLGSNEERFWLWAKRNDPPALYFARHHEHGSAAARSLLPVEPAWVIDALGLVTLDPAATYQGPFPHPNGALELRTTTTGPSGPVVRAFVIDPTRAWVLEQHAYDQSGQLLASAVAKEFRFHEISQVSLPEKVTLRVPSAELSLTINTGSISVNTPIANAGQHFAMPNLEGYPLVDLGRSDGLPTTAPPSASPWPVQNTVTPAAVNPSASANPSGQRAVSIQSVPPGGVELPGSPYGSWQSPSR